jgi:DNA-nicking Smr family endonuclease
LRAFPQSDKGSEMKSHDRKPAPEDAELLRASLSDVVPLARSNRAQLAKPRPRPIAAQRLRDERAALEDSLNGPAAWDSGFETGEELAFLRPGLPSLTLRKLRRGHWAIQDAIDLHGLTSPEARALLAEFLAGCLRRGLRCVRIIHGKGLRSKNREPVLKRMVAHWLMQRDEVLACCQARRTEGGGGAVVVLLKG